MLTVKPPCCYSDNTENGLSRQLERVRCLNTIVSSKLESLPPHSGGSKAMLNHLLLRDCRRGGITSLLGEFSSLAHHHGRRLRGVARARPFPPLPTRRLSAATIVCLGSLPTTSYSSSSAQYPWERGSEVPHYVRFLLISARKSVIQNKMKRMYTGSHLTHGES